MIVSIINFVIFSLIWDRMHCGGMEIGSLETEKGFQESSDHNSLQLNNKRDPRLLFLMAYPQTVCTNAQATRSVGVCEDITLCLLTKSVPSAICKGGFGIGVCCIHALTCGGTTSSLVSYFTNKNYPSSDTGAAECILTINKAKADICQVRLDYKKFESADPNSEGICEDSKHTITGNLNNNGVPQNLCGIGTGFHMYVSFQGTTPIQLKVTPGSKATWEIQVTQIKCSEAAPAGCLQYYTTLTGNVMSFNFPAPALNAVPAKTYQLANQKYSICIQPQAGFCSIAWKPPASGGNFFFSLSDDVDALGPGVAGTVRAMSMDARCVGDYIVIPSGVFTDNGGNSVTASKFCGQGFAASITSDVSPFNLQYFANGIEAPLDVKNTGFSLQFSQVKC